MTLPRFVRSSITRGTVTACVVCFALPLLALAAPNKALQQALWKEYPLTRVGLVVLKTDYNRITQPGTILAIRVPGIYADVANTENAIVNTNVVDGQVSQATGWSAAFGGSTSHSRTLNPNEKVYVTQVDVKRDAVQLELLTVDVTTLGDGQGTRYRAEVNFKIPGIDTMTAEDIKKTIDAVVADPATASAVQSKTVKLGMSPDEVKTTLGNPDKVVDLGAKQLFVYKDMKIVFVDGKVSDVQ